MDYRAMDHTKTIEQALTSENWREVGRNLLAKMLSEFMYEEVLTPEEIGRRGTVSDYRLRLEGGVEYDFEARRRLFDSYRVLPGSMSRTEAGESTLATDPLRFVLEAREQIGMTPETAAHLVRELNNTLIADAHILVRKQHSGSEVADLGYAELEGEMEGHPWISFNKGRIGFGYDDYLVYAPERKVPTRLYWLAVRSDRAKFGSVPGLDHEKLLRRELGAGTLANFREQLTGHGLDPADYYLLPVHEWQWKNVIVPLFPEDLVIKALVPLGAGEDEYLPQQSIRTFFNVSEPQKLSVKVPMSILNTLVWRGLPGERTEAAPRVTEFVRGIRDSDPFLRDECRLILLGEVASLNYEHSLYANLEGAPYQYREMLGAIWRESIQTHTEPGEHPVTLAALLHVDGRGRPFVSAQMGRSGLTAHDWTASLFRAVLPPLLHYLYRYGTVFSPHGENAILMLRDGAPERLAMKDFVDDVNLSDQPLPELSGLPRELSSTLLREPPEMLCQFIVAGLFICHLRYLSDLLEEHHGLPEREFWSLARETILEYQRRFPELEDRYRTFDLLAPDFTRLCLNRNRLVDYGYADDDDRPHAAEFGRVTNALHAVSQKETS